MIAEHDAIICTNIVLAFLAAGYSVAFRFAFFFVKELINRFFVFTCW